MNKFLLSLAAISVAAQVHAQSVTPQGQTTTTAPAEAVGAKPKKIKVNYTAETSVYSGDANKNVYYKSLISLQHVGLSYKLNAEQSVQLRQYFSYNLTDASKQDEWSVDNTMFRFTDSKQMTIGSLVVSGDTRFYLPMSKYQQKVGQYVLRHDLGVDQVFGKSTVSYGLSARAYGYTQNEDGQAAFRAIPSVGYKYEVNKVFSPYAAVATDSRWYNRGVGVTVAGPKAGKDMSRKSKASNSDKLLTDIGAEIALGEHVNLNVFMENAKDLRGNDKYDIFNDRNNFYEIDLTVSL